MRLEFDPESGALYIHVRQGHVEETLDLAEPGFGAHVDVDCEGNVLGLEFLSFEEYAELVTHFGGTLEIPERVEDSTSFPVSVPSNPWSNGLDEEPARPDAAPGARNFE